MSIFKALQKTRVTGYYLREADRSRETSSRAFARCADARAVREFGRWLVSQPPPPFALPGFPELSGVEEADQHGSGRYLHTNSTIATEARCHILDIGIFPFYSSEWPRFPRCRNLRNLRADVQVSNPFKS